MAASGGSSRQLRSTSSALKQEEMDKGTKHEGKGMSFIKVLDHDYSWQLQIPEEFTSNFNGCLPHRFIIEDIVTKKCWRVEMEEDVDSQIYLREGWHDFVESHSLEVGNFLLFEYEEQSIFHVKVYDRNGCEKICGLHKLEKTVEPEKLGENESFKCGKPVIAKPYRQKRTRKPYAQKKKSGISKKRRVAIKHYSRTAKASISETSCSFSITLHKRKMHQFIQLTIPKAISLQKLPNKEKVMLQNAEGGCWPVKILCRRDGRRIFAQGWKNFMKDNEFAGGDTLNFEFMSDDVVQVCATKTSQVKHHAQEANNQIEAKTSQVKHHAEEANKKQQTEEANNQIEAKTSQVKHHAEEVHKKQHAEKTNNQIEAKKSQVKHYAEEENKKQHAEEAINRIEAETSQVKDHAEEANNQIEARYIDNEHGIHEKDEAVKKKIRSVEVSISGERVCFSTCLQKSHQFLQITVPMAVTLMKLHNKKRVTLQDEKGSCWHVNVAHRRSGQALFTQGWRKFLKDNGFTTGDVLEFEFVSDDLIQVRTTKASLTDHHSEEANCENEVSEMDCEARGDDKPVTTVTEDQVADDSIPTEQVSSELGTSTFSITWRKDTMGTFLDIPTAVAEHQNLKNKETIVFRDPEGKCWSVQVRAWWDGRVVLTKGWVEFWKGQGVREGDSLHFEFVTEYLVQVTLERGDPTLEPVTGVVGADLPEVIIRQVTALPEANAAIQ